MRITEVEYIKDYKLKLVFSDEMVKIVDLENMIKRSAGIFSPLKNLDYFKQVALDDCRLSICWPNGADICPDVLYELGKTKKQDAKKPRQRARTLKTPRKKSKQTV
jgi:hypothetical protein